MKIDGRAIAQEILDNLAKRVDQLKEKNIAPHLHVITLTTDSASEAYVGQKELKGEQIGARITVENLDPDTTEQVLLEKIEKLNQDPTVHGTIIQRPFSSHINEDKIASSINPDKDVDGFHPDSKFSPPIANAVLRILEEIYRIKYEIQSTKSDINSNVQNSKKQNVLDLENSNLGIVSNLDIRYSDFTNWLKAKKICVIGRGVTAGKPVIETLQKNGIEPEVITSKTQNKKEILKISDIVICAVGKSNIIRSTDLKKGVILIGVGMFRGKDEKLHSDYEGEDIKNIASFYTPTPGGVGPVNVAQLLSNLLKAAEDQLS